MGGHFRTSECARGARPRGDDHLPPRHDCLRASASTSESARQLRSMRADAIIGFDLDGVFAPRRGAVHVAAIKGVLADEAKHERGIARFALTTQAWLEARHVRRADRVDHDERLLRRPHRHVLRSRSRAGRHRPRVDRSRYVGSSTGGCAARRGTAANSHRRPSLSSKRSGHAAARLCRGARRRSSANRRNRSASENGSNNSRKPSASPIAFTSSAISRSRALVAEYRNATLFALPTEQEGFGIVFLEAMASSLPIVATRVAAVPEVVSDGVTALS